MSVAAQRIAVLAALLVLSVITLPVVAFFLDGQGTENWILPVYLLVIVVVGAGVGRLFPGLAGPGAGTTVRRTVWVGALAGLGCAAAGLLLFFLLLSGIRGA